MTLSTRYAGRIAIADFEGRFALSPAVGKIGKRVEALLLRNPPTGLILNLAAVSAIDSAGLGELMKIHTFATRQRIRVALTGVNPRIAEVLKITRMDGLFTACADEASALQHVAQPQVADQP